MCVYIYVNPYFPPMSTTIKYSLMRMRHILLKAFTIVLFSKKCNKHFSSSLRKKEKQRSKNNTQKTKNERKTNNENEARREKAFILHSNKYLLVCLLLAFFLLTLSYPLFSCCDSFEPCVCTLSSFTSRVLHSSICADVRTCMHSYTYTDMYANA